MLRYRQYNFHFVLYDKAQKHYSFRSACAELLLAGLEPRKWLLGPLSQTSTGSHMLHSSDTFMQRKHAEVEEGTNKAFSFQVFTASPVVKVLRLIFDSSKQNNMLWIWVKQKKFYLSCTVYKKANTVAQNIMLAYQWQSILTFKCISPRNTAHFNGSGLFCMNLMQILYINHVLKMDPPNQRYIHLVISYSKLSIQATQQNHLCSELSGM